MKLKYEKLSKELENRISEDKKNNTLPEFSFCEENVLRRDPDKDKATLLRPAFQRDIEKIMHSPYYNRYSDKTQVFSFYKNDDITRRALHVQLVSRIARNIGKMLNLNLDLIEAIALGHDIGHTPFGHAGESFLDELYFAHTGRHFSHNIHSVRVLDKIFPLNLSLQTLSSIAAHDGELELSEYRPRPLTSFEEFDKQIEDCYIDKANVRKLVPSTLEGCVMRISDIIAYLGKDRQDAERAGLIDSSNDIGDVGIGTINSDIMNNLMVNIIENSYGKPYIKLDAEHYKSMSLAKRDNYEQIYKKDHVSKVLDESVRPMMQKMYYQLLGDLKAGKKSSPIYKHHVDFVTANHYAHSMPYMENEPNQIVVDYIASMTDDYCTELYKFLFPTSKVDIKYNGYFEDLE